MGYLNNSTITVDAILTKKGRELLSKGQTQFNITQFAVADDEVDYTLYSTAHPLGSNYYGSIIEGMPVLEASPDETQSMRYKLVSFDRGRKNIPLLNMQSTYDLQYNTNETINPSTTDDLTSAGYTAILYDSNIATLGIGANASLPTGTTTPFFAANQNVSANAQVLQGFSFTLAAKSITALRKTQLVVVNNLTGATKTATITVYPKPVGLP